METVFGGQEYFGMGKQNKVAKEQFLKANPEVSLIFYMYSYMPHKPVAYGITDVGYFEGNYTFGAIAGLKNYTRFQSYPYAAIKELVIDGGALNFTVDLSVDGAYLINQIGSAETITAPSSVTPAEIEIIIEGIHGAQQGMGIPLAQVINGQAGSGNNSEAAQVEDVKSIGDTADELIKAKSLLDMGAISEEEFADLKKKILGA